MSKTETNVTTLKINRGTYANIISNLDSISENELIITTDKNIPLPTTSDSGKVIKVNSSGEYELETDYSNETAESGGTTLSLVTTGDKYNWNNKQNALTFDNSPTANSNNPVKSGGVYTALSGKQDSLVFNSTYNASTNKVATMADVTGIYRIQGNASVVDLNNADKSTLSTGFVYNIMGVAGNLLNSDNTTVSVAQGDNVLFIGDGTNWEWDKLAATVDLSGYQTLITSTNKVAASNVSGLANVATSGSYNDLSNKPTLFSGSYNDLSNKPTIPDAVSGTNDGTNWTSITIGSTTKAIPAGGGNIDAITTAEINAMFGYSITVSITNGTYSGDTFIYTGNTANVTLTASTGYALPSSIIVSGASYNYSNGSVTLSNATSNVTVTVVCDTAPAGYTLTLNHSVYANMASTDADVKIKIGSAPSSENDYDYLATGSGGLGQLIKAGESLPETSDVVINNVSTVYIWSTAATPSSAGYDTDGSSEYTSANPGYADADVVTLSENTTLYLQAEIED